MPCDPRSSHNRDTLRLGQVRAVARGLLREAPQIVLRATEQPAEARRNFLPGRVFIALLRKKNYAGDH